MKGARLIAAIFAILALLICIIDPLWVFLSKPEDYAANFERYKTIFNWATLLWFVSSPLWMVPELFQKEDNE